MPIVSVCLVSCASAIWCSAVEDTVQIADEKSIVSTDMGSDVLNYLLLSLLLIWGHAGCSMLVNAATIHVTFLIIRIIAIVTINKLSGLIYGIICLSINHHRLEKHSLTPAKFSALGQAI